MSGSKADSVKAGIGMAIFLGKLIADPVDNQAELEGKWARYESQRQREEISIGTQQVKEEPEQGPDK